MLASFFANLVVGFWSAHKEQKIRQEWFRFGASLFGTAFVSFWGTWGAAGATALLAGSNPWIALISGFFSACVMMAAMVLYLWKRSPLTKGIPIAAPGKVEEAILKLLEQEGISYTEPR